MFVRRPVRVLFAAALSVLAACAAARPAATRPTTLQAKSTPAELLPPDAEQHPLHSQIEQFARGQARVREFQPTRLTRADYLRFIAGEVAALRKCQDPAGRIIDPVLKREVQYATPCYAHAVATLAFSGDNSDGALIESGMKAMDVATADMAAGRAADGHGDFYTYPVMRTLDLFARSAAPDRVKKWRDNLAQVDPKKLYRSPLALEGNWAVVNLSGEYLRAAAGLGNPDYVEKGLAPQLNNFTELGMYHEGGDPLPYDHFPRHFLAGIMASGYRGPSFERCRDLVWRGAWTSLFMQSPFGEMPTGYRSSHHIWNEAESAVTYEIYASQYARAGKPAEAGAFKRAAHLSLRSMQDWIRPDGSGYIVKNRYPIEAQHGYEGYSSHTQYNLLACSMLATAWQFADEMIEERPAPADLGGFVVAIEKPFHKIFANAGGTYVEYDTSGDHVYNPTGLIRVHVKGGHPQLGPSDGCAPKFSGKGVNIAVGPSWQDAAGKWRSLAECTSAPKVEVLEESPARCAFRVTYPDVIETVTIAPSGVTVEDRVTAPDVKAMRVNYPMLVFDGRDRTEVRIAGPGVTLRLDGRQVRFAVTDPAGATLQRSGREIKHRNGLVEPISAEVAGNRAMYRIGGE